MRDRPWEQDEWLTREELERLRRQREFHQYLGTTVGPSRPQDEILQGDEMRVEVSIYRDLPGD